MNKQKLIEHMISQLQEDLTAAIAAAKATYEAATHEESKPENEYDTRGLEASYLAGAQAKRVGEIEELLSICRHLEIKGFSKSDTVSATALLEVQLGSKKIFLFLLPKGGGHTMQFEGKSVQVITPTSPLGEALLGLKVGDFATVEMGPQTREYEIISIQ